MISSNSTRSLSRLDATTRRFWRRPWHNQHMHTPVLVLQHMVMVLGHLDKVIRHKGTILLVSLEQSSPVKRKSERQALDGQPPNNAVPYSQHQPGFQPPYPIASPPPQSHTPSNQYPPPSLHTARRQSQPDSYAPYPPPDMNTSYGPPPSQQDSSRPGHQPYPNVQPPNVQQLQQDDGKDYSPSNYSTEDLHAPHHQQAPPQAPSGVPSSFAGPPPHQQNAPVYPPPSAPGGPGGAPYDYQPPPAHGPPPVPSAGPGPNQADRPVTPLPQSSAYPVFSGSATSPQYQAYNARPASVTGGPGTGYYR